MKAFRWFAVTALLTVSIAASAQTTVYKLNYLQLTNGWTVTGTITTDRTTGALIAANIVDWNLKVVQTTDMVWTEKDSNDLNIWACRATDRESGSRPHRMECRTEARSTSDVEGLAEQFRQTPSSPTSHNSA